MTGELDDARTVYRRVPTEGWMAEKWVRPLDMPQTTFDTAVDWLEEHGWIERRFDHGGHAFRRRDRSAMPAHTQLTLGD